MEWKFFLILVSKIVANSPLGEDVLRLAGYALNLFAQAANVHVYGAQIAQVVVLPDGLQQVFTAEDLAAVGGEELQKIKLLGGEVDLLAADGDAAVVQVQVRRKMVLMRALTSRMLKGLVM